MESTSKDVTENNLGSGDSLEMPFHKKMRKATREIHALSDALVNAKLAFALSHQAVWADGLLIFYEIFRFLEGAMIRLKNTYLGNFLIDGLQRTVAFEEDLKFYLGPNWNKDYIPRESVTRYIMHLQELERNEPLRLVAYAYHLYMGLLSGGQILRHKMELSRKLYIFSKADEKDKSGNAVTNFGDTPIFKLKHEVIELMNRIAESLNDDERQSLIEESKTVFELNNSIIKTVKGTSQVVLKKFVLYLSILLLFSYSMYCVFK